MVAVISILILTNVLTIVGLGLVYGALRRVEHRIGNLEGWAGNIRQPLVPPPVAPPAPRRRDAWER